MKTIRNQGIALLVGLLILFFAHVDHDKNRDSNYVKAGITTCYELQGCVFNTIFGKERSISSHKHFIPAKITQSIDKGLDWMKSAQLKNGGWGAGSHAHQNMLDPHAVAADPATTAMVGMAFLRSGSTHKQGQYSKQVNDALRFLLLTVENSPNDRMKITDLSGTQIQTKLGDNIDAVLAMQFFSNILDCLENEPDLKKRVMAASAICVDKIQRLQESDGSIKGSGWAGVLQSALANNALESSASKGVDIDPDVLIKSREYQKSNFDPTTGNVDTDKGAGIVLYSVSGSVRASAKEARKVREEMEQAIRDGRIGSEDRVSAESLEKIGFSKDEALRYSTSYQVYESAKRTAQNDEVMTGFGNNGGEEFLSYLQTGESLIINDDQQWEQWYESISGRLISIQNEDGSWQGHHCITSPVFCTATSLLTLSISNDIDQLLAQGK